MLKNKTYRLLALIVSLIMLLISTANTTFCYIVTETESLVNNFVPVVSDDNSIAINIYVNKIVNNTGDLSIGPAGFEFVLENTISGEKQTVKSDENGKAVFVLQFTAADVGKCYTYKLYETNEGVTGVTYDTKVYDISIAISNDTDEKLRTAVVMDGKTLNTIVAKFENTYYDKYLTSPPTEDNSNIIISLILIVSGIASTILFLLNKKRNI